MAFRIGEHAVGADQPLFVIAELGLNHGGDVRRALRLVDVAAEAGASAIKLQSFRSDRLVAQACPAPAHVHAESLCEFFQRFELDADAHRLVAERAHTRGLAFVATAFDLDSLEMLQSVGCDAIKIASGDLTFQRLIQRAAGTGRPLVLSTGMGSLEEVRTAVRWAHGAGADDLAVLQCVSAYPVPHGHENLRAIVELRRACGDSVGLSDHSTEPLCAPLAVALGASIYERHLALGEPEGRYDLERPVSSTGAELAAIVTGAARARSVLGDGRKACLPVERDNRLASRRSLHLARAHRAGDIIDAESLVALRPAVGMDPCRWDSVMGRRFAQDRACGEPLYEADLASPGSLTPHGLS